MAILKTYPALMGMSVFRVRRTYSYSTGEGKLGRIAYNVLMPNVTLHLSDELAAQILQAAARAHPAECCGLIEGVETESGWRALATHEAANLAPEPKRRFLIDPQVQFDLMRRLRGSERSIIGCFHSHPDGSAQPSATDRAEAYESGFLYLIAAGAAESGFTLKAYLFEEGTRFTPIGIASGE